MAGITGKSGPPGNQNAFRHGLAGISQRRANGALAPDEQAIREEILFGLVSDKGGEAQISTTMRILAEVIASDAAWLVAINRAIDGVMASNQRARNNPKALHSLDGYKRGLVNSLTGNLQRFGFEKMAKIVSLQEIIEDMTGDPGTSDNSSPDCPMTSAKWQGMMDDQPLAPPFENGQIPMKRRRTGPQGTTSV